MGLLNSLLSNSGTGDEKKAKPVSGKGMMMSILSQGDKSGIQGYKSNGNEKTPTGLDNDFSNSGFNEGDIMNLAKQMGFRTDSNEALQQDLEKYLNDKHPEILQETIQKFGMPKAGKFADGKLGARTVFALSRLVDKGNPPSNDVEQQEHTPDKETPKEDMDEQPNSNYVINVRGDSKDGAYYFPKSKAEYDKIVSMIPSWKSEESDKNSGQATYDMNDSVFNQYHANNADLKALLGSAYKRVNNKFVKR